MKFKKEHLTQTELEQIFGVSSHEVGNWLVDVGLRTEKKRPSGIAHHDGFCCHDHTGSWGYRWVWHAEKTVNALIEAGHRPTSPPPGELLEASILEGPFMCRVNETGMYEIVGDDGFPAVWVIGEQNAKTVTRLMTLSHEHGVFERINEQQSAAPPTGAFETEGFVIVG